MNLWAYLRMERGQKANSHGLNFKIMSKQEAKTMSTKVNLIRMEISLEKDNSMVLKEDIKEILKMA